MTIRTRGLLLSTFSAISLCTANAQIAISSTFDIAVEADADQLSGGNAIDTYSATQLGTLNPYSHSLSVTNIEAGNGNVTTTSSASANWNNAGSGTVTFRNMGWTRDTLQRHEAKLNNFFSGTDVWSYTFQATSNGFLNLNYNVSFTGSGFGLLGIMIHWTGSEGNLDLENAFNPTAVGTFTGAVTNGNTYTIGIYNAGNIFAAAGQGFSTSHLNGDFSWTIGAVPEPATLAALAIGGLGLFVRRRRS